MNKKSMSLFFIIIGAHHILLPKIPIVYRDEYTISVGPTIDAMARWIHPFDPQKYKKVYQYLTNTFEITDADIYQPEKITDHDLLTVHSQAYLDSLQSSGIISQGIDLSWLMAWIPNAWLQKGLLDPQRYAVGGTVLAAQLALIYGWALSIGGRFHHAKRDAAGGGCFFADIPLAIETLWQQNPDLKIVIVDLDAHQGNGYEDYFKNSFGTQKRNVFIFDMFNKNEYPKNVDNTVRFIDRPISLDGGQLKGWPFSQPTGRRINDTEYLDILKKELPAFIDELIATNNKPHLIIYNAGTDPYIKDPWGCMALTKEGMIVRDLYVVTLAEQYNIPFMLLLSGGYAPDNAELISACLTAILEHKGVPKKL